MSMFREICQFIEDRTGFTKASGTLQVGHRVQNAPVRCVLVAQPAGGEPNYYCPEMANLNIQVLSRAKTYFEAEEDIWTVFNALTKGSGEYPSGGWNIPRIDGSGGDYLAMVIEALQTPAYIGQDDNGRYEFSVNFIFRMEEGSCGP
jgi:hypothetical protein